LKHTPTIRDDLMQIERRLRTIQDGSSRIDGGPLTAGEQIKREIGALVDEVDAVARIMTIVAIDLGYPAPGPVIAASDAYGAGCDDPSRIAVPLSEMDIPSVEIISEHDIDGRGHVIVCLYPFDCERYAAADRFIRCGANIWRVRGLEHSGPLAKGAKVGLLVSPVMVTGEPSRADAVADAEHIQRLGLEEVADGAYGDGPLHRAAARRALGNLDQGSIAKVWSLILSDKQIAYARAALEFVWDEEGAQLPTGATITEAELDDMLQQFGKPKGETK
jgi:hypothetical protein